MRGDIGCATSGLVPGAGGDPASPIGRLRLSLADLRNDIGVVDSAGALSNAFPSEARQEGAAVFIDMRNVAQEEMDRSPLTHRLI